jgi:hypothetical protein
MIAVATLGCTRKRDDLDAWNTLVHLQGEYRLYINWEQQAIPNLDENFLVGSVARLQALNPVLQIDADIWNWRTLGTSWRATPKFDQDQARLASIVVARNMAIEYAMQTEASHLLFIDADIVPPLDIIPRLLEVGRDAVGGLVYGRGVHQSMRYVQGEKRRYTQGSPLYTLIEAEHGNIGFCMISRKLFENVRFRYGTSNYPDGRCHMISDDPAFHLDVFIKFGEWMVVREDVVGTHLGTLTQSDVSQF